MSKQLIDFKGAWSATTQYEIKVLQGNFDIVITPMVIVDTTFYIAKGTTTIGVSPNVEPLEWQAMSPFNNTNGTVAPGATNDFSQGFVATSLWIDQVTAKVYCCLDNNVGAAVWAALN
jgi:hypothetical protein